MARVDLLLLLTSLAVAVAERTFSIDYDNNQFLRDGKPFRYISGSIHYFRIHPDQWEARIQSIRAAGLNAIEMYIPWNFHETYKGTYDFTGMRNFTHFFELAAKYDLAVIVRPGPYICADFLREALTWWDQLLPMIRPYLWRNNGPVIMVQIENEYGSFGCDHVYLNALRDKAIEQLGNDTVLFTTDPPETIECGLIDGVFATVDFGEKGLAAADEYFKIQREANKKKGPAVNSECYPGWYRTWGEKGSGGDISANVVLKLTEKMYNLNASFNYYMFHGGTNFGFWNGAEYAAGLITSYDYFAPMTENGDYNDKYKAIRDFISGIKDWPNPPQDLPAKPTTFAQSNVVLRKIGNWFDFEAKTINSSRCVQSPLPKTFEDGRLSPHYKPHEVKELRLQLRKNDLLEIYVENQGRLTWETANDKKGIIAGITLDGSQLTGWTSCPVDVEQLTGVSSSETGTNAFGVGDVYSGDFSTPAQGDTFIDLSNWGKGIVWVNGFNLGRYWSTAGPQKYLYVPSPLLSNRTINRFVFLELEMLSSDCKADGSSCSINLLDHPIKYK
ncbi:glycosyl hydrolase family 35 [Necator americanus]|uniref:Glycosyl hydrolase family 35 n=1 Tax=Necator americanus TaxID=51031 RepID=W2TMU1_NECAM|nr:glycosyl hydrolase family 35 [Necator americanus]ETN82984.1 glycosyl hydrolase family 35 [Necator americanus]